MEDRKDLAMKNQRSFNIEFGRQIVEELLDGESRPARLCRRHNISASLLYHWKKQYSGGKLNNKPTEEVYLREYKTIADVMNRLHYFIEEVYNIKRLHSAPGYQPPDEFEQLLVMKQEKEDSLQTILTLSVQP